MPAGKSFGNSCTKFVILDVKYRFTCGDSDLCLNIKKCQNIMTWIVDQALACNFIIKRVWHKCFPVNFEKFLRIPFYKKPLGKYFQTLKTPITKFCNSDGVNVTAAELRQTKIRPISF